MRTYTTDDRERAIRVLETAAARGCTVWELQIGMGISDGTDADHLLWNAYATQTGFGGEAQLAAAELLRTGWSPE